MTWQLENGVLTEDKGIGAQILSVIYGNCQGIALILCRSVHHQILTIFLPCFPGEAWASTSGTRLGFTAVNSLLFPLVLTQRPKPKWHSGIEIVMMRIKTQAMIEIKKYNWTILTPLWAFMDKFSQNVDKQLWTKVGNFVIALSHPKPCRALAQNRDTKSSNVK